MGVVLVAITVVFAILFMIMGIEYFKNESLDEIRKDVYDLFLKAEHEFVTTGAGKQKMKWVVSKARSMLPSWMQLIITEELFEQIIQLWFDGIKDLLDDGKINN